MEGDIETPRTVGELIEVLAAYGEHLPVIAEGQREGTYYNVEVEDAVGGEANAVVIRSGLPLEDT